MTAQQNHTRSNKAAVSNSTVGLTAPSSYRATVRTEQDRSSIKTVEVLRVRATPGPWREVYQLQQTLSACFNLRDPSFLLYQESTVPSSQGSCQTQEKRDEVQGVAPDTPSSPPSPLSRLTVWEQQPLIHTLCLFAIRSNHTSACDFGFILKVITARLQVGIKFRFASFA